MKTKIFINYVMPIIVVVILFFLIVCYGIVQNNKEADFLLTLNIKGVITDISSAGRGSYKIKVKLPNGEKDSVYFLGLGEHDGDILIGDSISKNSGEYHFNIYRIIDSTYSLVYLKEIRRKW